MAIIDEAFAGQPISAPVIDAHSHILNTFFGGWYQTISSNDEIVALMDHVGIDCIVTAPHPMITGEMEFTNACAASAIAEHPGRIYGYIFICPHRGLKEIGEALGKYSKIEGFVGLKFLPGYHGPLNCPEYDYALDFAREAQCPVLCHKWGNEPTMDEVARVARLWPEVKFITAHQGGGNSSVTDAYAPLIKEYPNLMMELCGSLFNNYGLEEYVDLIGEDRIIYGSDMINLDPSYDLGQVVFSSVSDKIKQKILAGNYLRLLEGSSMSQIRI